MKATVTLFVRMTAVIAAALLLIGIFAQIRKASPDADDEEDKSEAVQTPSRVSVQNGETVLTLDPGTQARAGIAVAPLQTASQSAQASAPATVLSAQDLVGLRNNYVAASAELEKARANADMARKEYERLKSLFDNDQNTSQKSLETAEASMRSNDADVRAAEQALALAEDAVRQSWGDAVAGWVAANTLELKRVLSQSDLLVQVTVPADQVRSAPRSLVVVFSGSIRAQASLVSAFPRVDPRMQGASFLYEVPTYPGLAPGANLVAQLPVGPNARGVLVPESAVVWWQGGAWIYKQISPGHFTRQAIPTSVPLGSGYFVSKGFSSGDLIVLKGADWLLSEEFRYQAQAEGED